MHSDRVGSVDFPTLGDLVDAWIEQHCRIPDGYKRKRPFVEYDWQFWCTANHYRVREDAVCDPDDPPMGDAFFYRRTDVVAAQKLGKGPWASCLVANMAVGPELFIGWAKAGDVYDCADHGCGCGWYYEYESGEPMGGRHPSPLIQVLATSQDQVDNIWRPLTAMIRVTGAPLGRLLLPREEFIRVVGENEDDPDLDRIDAVTADAIQRRAWEEIGSDQACGVVPVRGGLELARRHGQHVRLLDLRTSGDTAGDPHRVVGYGSFEIR